MKASEIELLLAKNQFCKNPGFEAYFKKYYNVLIKLEKKAVNSQEKLSMLEQADSALAVFCEKADLNDDVIKRIAEYQMELETRFMKLNELTKKQEEDNITSIIEFNDGILDELLKLKKIMSTITSQSVLDDRLNRLAELDGSIEKDYLTEPQKKRYDELTNDFSIVVSERVNLLNAMKERQYNSEALKEIHTVYFRYKGEEKKYKDFNDDTKDLVCRLFNFNSSRLTTEVQIYYNHVYSYIFSKLNDEDKFALTEMSLKRFEVE